MNFEKHKQYVERFGLGPWVYHLFYNAGQRWAGLYLLKGMTLTSKSLNPDHRRIRSDLTCLRLTVDEFARSDKDGIVTEVFLAGARSRNDWCYCFLDGDEIVSFGWYSSRPVPVTGGYAIHYSDRFVYMYNGFTAPSHRGEQLHAIGMAAALEQAQEDGYEGLISYVEADNAASLRSISRLGYEVFGTCTLVDLAKKRFTWATSGCDPYEFRLEYRGDP
jgi:L-amino acid N-acyltransferase YncA